MGSDSKVEARPIQIDFAEGNLSVIHSGLQAGEQVVFDGQDKLQPGAKVVSHPTNLNTGVGSSAGSPSPIGDAAGTGTPSGGRSGGGQWQRWISSSSPA